MTFPAQSRFLILQLLLVLFKTSPGAVNLKILDSLMQKGESLENLAQSLVNSALFFGEDYSHLSPAAFATAFVNDLLGNDTSADNRALILDFVANQLVAGVTPEELIAELTGAISLIPPSDRDWGAAALHYYTNNATKILDHLLADTFTPTDKAIVADHIVIQVANGKTFGEMAVWAIRTVNSVDHENVVWGKAARLFKNRFEVSKYYTVDLAGATIDLSTMRNILSGVTSDEETVTAAKDVIAHLLRANKNLPHEASMEYLLDKTLSNRKSNFISIARKTSQRIELTV